MGALLKSSPCRGCPTRICLKTCDDKKKWEHDKQRGEFPIAANLHGEAKPQRAFDVATAIEALRLSEDGIREVRQGLEAQLRREKQMEILRSPSAPSPSPPAPASDP